MQVTAHAPARRAAPAPGVPALRARARPRLTSSLPRALRSTLIKEVKLCVGPEHLPALDALYEKLTSQQIPAEMAVKQLMELVGSTIVQQAGLSVMNSQKGVLPHGWLEYTDEGSGRPYYYNVHTKVTTWYKPSGNVPPPPPPDPAEEEAHGINLACTLDTHNVAMTGFI